MTTHEQKDRNAEIVQRRLGGEATGVLALEYGVTATRIAQLVRRHREKAGERPNGSRRKKPSDAVRPHLRKVEFGLWECSDGTVSRRGETQKEAYDRWMLAAIAAAQPAQTVRQPMPDPMPAYAGPVTVVPGMRPGRELTLSPAMQLAGARAMAAQPKTPSLSGGRRGGE